MMSEIRQPVHEAICDEISETSGQVVSGWILILETVDSEGERDLELISSDATGDHGIPDWSGIGWLEWAKDNLAFAEIDIETGSEEDDEDD